jgi:coenzyme F420-reducing hydrogenase delta subunit
VSADGYLYFDPDTCIACGACASQCPAQAITLEIRSEEGLSRRVDSVVENPGPDTTLRFACGGSTEPPRMDGDVRTLTVSCLLHVSERLVLKALGAGAKRVVFVGCAENACRYPNARELVAAHATRITSVLRDLDMENSFIMTEDAEEKDTVQAQ